MDVVGVVTPLIRGGAQVVLHGDQVVELSVLLGVHEKGEVEEDGEDQVEVERDESGMRLKNTLSHEVHVTQTSRGVPKLRALCACSQVVQLARVGVRVLVSTQPSAQTFVCAQLPIQTSSQHCHDTSYARWSRP